jgi:predicted nucleic acid-binding protein
MKIKLNLKKHCVETELKRLYNRSLSQYFKPGSNQKQNEKIIDVIKTVLENSNISNLRSKYPELSGNSEADILLSTDRQDQIVILINGLEINPFEKA